MTEFVYMIMERDAIRISELENFSVVKIGRTSKGIVSRMTGYPKGSQVLAVACVANSVDSEKRLISLFDDKFEQETDHGREYYSGDLRKMQKIFHKFATTEVTYDDVESESEELEELVELVEEIQSDLVDMNLVELTEDPDTEVGTINGSEYVCNKCYRSFKEKHHLKQHNNRKSECTAKFQCPKCSVLFEKKYLLDRHLKRLTRCDIDKTSNSNKTCNACLRSFTTRSNLLRHQQTCVKMKPIDRKDIINFLKTLKQKI